MAILCLLAAAVLMLLVMLTDGHTSKSAINRINNRQQLVYSHQKYAAVGSDFGGVFTEAKLASYQKWIRFLQHEGFGDKLNDGQREPARVFGKYSKVISNVFRSTGGIVNLFLVGACDGQSDGTISKLFLPRDHWRAIFVEPVPINVRDLRLMLLNYSATNRAFVVEAAMRDLCLSEQLVFNAPQYELHKDTAHMKHWRRRQIGHVVDSSVVGLRQHDTTPDEHWAQQKVACTTGPEVLREWKKHPWGGETTGVASLELDNRRVHILKVDAEGFELPILRGLFGKSDGTGGDGSRVEGEAWSDRELPLIVLFESKIISRNATQARLVTELLQSRGYQLSELGHTDALAVLPPEKILF